MPQADLSRCPECGYDLRGLPPPHRCPECGFEYDEFTRVWKPRRPARLFLTLGGTTILVWLNVGFDYLPGFGAKRVRGWVDVAWLLTGIICTIALAYQVLQRFVANRRGRYIAIVPDGIRMRTIGDSKLVPWTNVKDWIGLGNRVNLEFATALDQAQIKYLLDTPESMADFCDWLNEGRQRYTAQHSLQQSPRPAG